MHIAYLTQYTQNIIILKCIQYTQLLRYFTLFLSYVFEIQWASPSPSTSPLEVAPFQVLIHHMWLVAAELDNTGVWLEG